MDVHFFRTSVGWRLYVIIFGIVLMMGSFCAYLYFYKANDDRIYENLLEHLSRVRQLPTQVENLVGDVLAYQQEPTSELGESISASMTEIGHLVRKKVAGNEATNEDSLFYAQGLAEVVTNLEDVVGQVMTSIDRGDVSSIFHENIELLGILPEVVKNNVFRYVNSELNFAVERHDQIVQRNRFMGAMLIVFGLLSLMLVFLMTAFVRKSIILPLQGLKHSIDTYDFSGNAEIEVDTADEIGSLSRAFHEMAGKVKDRENALRESEEKYRQFYSQAPVMLHNIDMEGRLIAVNDEWLAVLGYEREEVLGTESMNYLTESSREKAAKLFPMLYGDGFLKDVEYTMITKSGEEREVRLTAYMEKDAEGMSGARAAIIDVTEGNRIVREKEGLEQQLLQAQKMEAVGTLAGGIAHDFNNILSSIFGFTELAKFKAGENETVQKHLDHVLASGERAKELVKHLLTFSRKANVSRSVMKVTPLLKETVKFIRATIPSTITVSLRVENDQVCITADPTQMHQILMNISTNAAHAMKDSSGGKLDIVLRRTTIREGDSFFQSKLKPGDYAQLTVADTGHGIPKDKIDRIFDPFFTTKGKGEGTGLGLSVTYGIVQEMLGHISVNSEPGKGTTFQVFFPAASEEETLSESDGNRQIMQGTGTLLVVDDEESIVEWTSELLDDLGYEVIGCIDAEEALATFRADPKAIDLVLTDLTMPKIVGTELAEQMHEVRPELPIILCTGFSEGLDQESLERSGIAQMVMKPVIASELSRIISESLQKENPALLSD